MTSALSSWNSTLQLVEHFQEDIEREFRSKFKGQAGDELNQRPGLDRINTRRAEAIISHVELPRPVQALQ